jgi:phosphomannomutase
MAAVFKAYGIRVYFIDRYSTAAFISYFNIKFKCLFGIIITGRDSSKEKNGCMIFNQSG